MVSIFDFDFVSHFQLILSQEKFSLNREQKIDNL
jgi:hypothetical protein